MSRWKLYDNWYWNLAQAQRSLRLPCYWVRTA